ncbi:MAG TPA: carboxypeptidase regulatory-like domain-containing protein [Vicinamibacterales bacterium]|nr:carboxypeptidase regulatory-like domain-containing protein [Vicinamibacterales bacterium]
MRALRHLGWGLLCVLAISATATAQQNASISGIVTDMTGGVLPGVTIEASSPVLIEKIRTAVSEANGRYQVLDLLPGTYRVTFTLPGFSVVRREGITLTAGFAASVNVELSTGTLTETITVTGASPVVDVRNVAQTQVLTRDVLDSTPNARVIGSLMTLVPGVTITTAGGPNVDAGGTAGYTYAAAQIHGSSQYDQTIGTYGIPMTLIDNIGKSRINLPDGTVQEYDMRYSSLPAELAYGGFTVNAIPKVGGNSFTGSIFLTGTGSALQSSNLDDELRAQGLTAEAKVKNMVDFNPVIGGPIARDKIWFFGGLRYQYTDSYVGGMWYDKNPSDWIFEPDPDRPANADQLSYDLNVNTTWQASQKDRINVLLMRNVTHWYHSSVSGTVAPEAGQQWYAPGHVELAKWTSTRSNRLLLDVTGSRYFHDFVRDPTDTSTRSQIVDQGSGITFGGLATSAYTGQLVYTVRAALSYSTGMHNLKVGWDWAAQIKPDDFMTFSMPGTREQCGTTGAPRTDCLAEDASYRTISGVPNQVTFYTTPWPDPQTMNPAGIYVQDQISLNKWTVNAGLRFDYLNSSYPAFDVAPRRYVPVEEHFEGADVLSWKDLSPRIAISYDPFGTGKTALKAAASRYVMQERLTQSTALVIPTRASVSQVSRTWTDLDRDYVVDGDPLNPALNGELGASPNANFGKRVTNFRLDPDWATGFGTRPYNWEFMGAIQTELAANLSLQAGYYRRVFGNFIVTDNLLTSPSDYDPFCITVPSDARLPGGGGGQMCGLYDLNPTKLGQVDTIQTSSSNYGKQLEHYNGVDVTVNGRLPRGGLLQGGFSMGRTMTDYCDVVGKLDNPSLMPQPTNAAGGPAPLILDPECHKQGDWLPQVKLIGSYPLPWEFRVSGTYQTLVLDPITNGTSNLGFISNYVATNAVVAPSLGRPLSGAANVTINLLGAGEQYDKRTHQIDLRFSRTFDIGRSRLQANIDLYNVLNANFVATRNGNYGTNGATWLRPGAILPARLLKFGGQFNF